MLYQSRKNTQSFTGIDKRYNCGTDKLLHGAIGAQRADCYDGQKFVEVA